MSEGWILSETTVDEHTLDNPPFMPLKMIKMYKMYLMFYSTWHKTISKVLTEFTAEDWFTVFFSTVAAIAPLTAGLRHFCVSFIFHIQKTHQYFIIQYWLFRQRGYMGLSLFRLRYQLDCLLRFQLTHIFQIVWDAPLHTSLVKHAALEWSSKASQTHWSNLLPDREIWDNWGQFSALFWLLRLSYGTGQCEVDPWLR